MNKKEFLLSIGADPAIFNLKNITRIGSKRVADGWWVRINRDGIKKSKIFSDQNYITPIESLQAAMQYRDSFRPQKINNNTGYKYIFISIEKNNYAILRINYKGKEKAFSINAQGYFTALINAIKHLNKITKQQYMPVVNKIDVDKGLIYLNKNINIETYRSILQKTLIAKELYYQNRKDSKLDKKKTILLIAYPNSIMDRNAIYSTQMRATLGYIKRKGYTYKIVGENFKYDKEEYFTVYHVMQDISSKEFCFRLKKLIDAKTKKFYTIQKKSQIFKGIYRENPKVLKEIINIIPDFQDREDLRNYFEKQIENLNGQITANAKKINTNLSNKDYVRRKKLQIKYLKNKIQDYKQLILWNKNTK